MKDTGNTVIKNGYKKTKLGWIPEDWEVAELGEIGQVVSGLTYSPQDVNDNGTLVLRSSNVQKENLSFEDTVYVDTEGLSYNPVIENDILICVRNGSKHLIGKNTLITKEVAGMAFGAFMSVFRSDLNNYLIQYFKTDIYNKEIHKNLGATINSINGSELKRFKVPLPPRSERQKIATILSTWDRAIAKQERLITAKQEFKKGLMQLLLTGKKRFEGFEGEWEILEFEKIAERTKGKFDCKKEVTNKRCIELEHLNQDTGTINGWTDSKNQKSIKNVFSEGQVLFGKLRPYLRKFWFASFSGVCSSEIWVLDSVKGASSNDYLFFLVQSNRFIQIANATTGSKMPRADWSYLSKFPFKTPKIPEQQKIASVLSAADKEIGLLQSELATLRGQKRGLMQRLLTGEVRVEI